jgi:hypothetical protein
VPPPSTAGVTVSTITLGNAIGPDRKVTQAADSFGSKDTIYYQVEILVDDKSAGTKSFTVK